MADINIIKLGYVTAFLINKNVLVDTGKPSNGKKILLHLDKLGVKANDIELIILTHGHSDHIGSVKEMVDTTGAKVLMHRAEYNEIYVGTQKDDYNSRMMAAATKNAKKTALHNPKCIFNPDIIIDDDYVVSEYKIDGKVIFTPGHTKGSVSILFENGDSIIGDSLMAFLPLSKPGKPIIADNYATVKKSMENLIKMGATRFYLSHGDVYGLEEIQEAIKKL